MQPCINRLKVSNMRLDRVFLNSPQSLKKLVNVEVLQRSAVISAAILMFGANNACANNYDCLIEPYASVDLGTAVTGIVDKVLVKRGDRVSRGQVLVHLESSAETAAAELAKFKSLAQGGVKSAQSKVEFAQKKFERRKEMAAEKLIAAQERDDAEAELRLAEAELVSVREARDQAAIEYKQQSSLLALRSIRSPVDGVVVDQVVSSGEIAEAGGKKPLLKLAQLDPLRVRVMLPMAMFGKIRAGTPVELSPENAPNVRLKAIVRQTDKVLDAASGTHVILLDLPNRVLDIPSGVKCKAKIEP
jgi:RND family efflux transporter MFP subunit